MVFAIFDFKVSNSLTKIEKKKKNEIQFPFVSQIFSSFRMTEKNAFKKLDNRQERVSDIAASFQATAVKVLCEKTMRAVEEKGCYRVLLGGGVSANVRLRNELAKKLSPEGTLYYSSPKLSADNAAMIACAGAFRFSQGEIARDDLSANPNLPFPGLRKRETRLS